MRFWPLFVCPWHLLLHGVSGQSQAETEHKILLEFFKETGGSSWNDNTGWETNEDNFCDWYGVVCEGEEEQELDGGDSNRRRNLQDADASALDDSGPKPVVALQLKTNNLIGRIPPSLWELPKLHTLVLSFNFVEISFTAVSTALTELRMHSTSTKTMEGVDLFTNLRFLEMSGNQLGNIEIPKAITKLSKLEHLFMAECELQGTLPTELARLTLLEVLSLFNNNLGGTIAPSMFVGGNGDGMQKLTELSLSNNHFHGVLPTTLNDLPDLADLFLDNNQFEGPLLSFHSQPNLYKLNLNSNHLTGNIPNDFMRGVLNTGAAPEAPQLRINLEGNYLGPLIPSSLDSLGDLDVRILLANNLFTGFEDDQVLCDNSRWMDGNVAQFGCNAILCPVGTFNPLGRQTSSSKICEVCETAEIMGETLCAESGNPVTVLQELYSATGGASWTKSTNWFSNSSDFCTWYGIECYKEVDSSHVSMADRIKWIELPDNNLVGTVPKSIYTLDGLTRMNFANNNNLVVPFDGVSQLETLFYVDITRTATTSLEGIEDANDFFFVFIADYLDIEGRIPHQLLRLSSLRVLSLAQCGISGSIPTALALLNNLEELYLYGNKLHGEIPSQLGEMTNLKIASLATNRLTGTLPSTLEDGWTNLEAFSLQDQVTKGGGVSGNVLPFAKSPNLRLFLASNNKLEGSIPPNLMIQTNTTASLIVDFSSNIFTGTVPGALSRFENLNIMVEDNLIMSVDNTLCALDDWMNGDVREYGCDAIACPMYTTAPGGRRRYDSMQCTDCTDPGARPFVGQTKCGGKDTVLTERNILRLFYANCNGPNWRNHLNWDIQDQHVCDWHGVSCDDAKSVVSIALGHNNLAGNVPTQIYTLPNLARLSLFANNIRVSFDGIENAGKLTSLVLDSTYLESVSGIGKAVRLKELNLRSNLLRGPIPTELSQLGDLESLLLANNHLSGTLPDWLEDSQELISLLLNDNQLSGPLLSFDKHPRLTMINVSTNGLSGTIPDTFLMNSPTDFRIIADISLNFLTGTIPASLKRHTHLVFSAQDNLIVAVAPELCEAASWNGGDVAQFGCDGILCPSGAFRPALGRQSSNITPCMLCQESFYMGATHCGISGGKSSRSSTLAMIAVATVSLWLCLRG